ncbi:hypothetical protein [Halostagnicola kamekurae]|nr:hypothetical protein [Halostagnicola kamekurae]
MPRAAFSDRQAVQSDSNGDDADAESGARRGITAIRSAGEPRDDSK